MHPKTFGERAAAAGADCAYVLAALTLIGVAGAFWPLADLVNNFAPLWAALAFVGIGISFLLNGRRRLRALGMFAAAFAWNIWLIAPEFTRRPPAPGAGAIKIIAFNVWGFNASLRPTIDYLRRTPADFVVLSEVNDADIEALEVLRDAYPYQTRCASAPDCRMLILSKWRPTRQGETPSLAWREVGMDDSPRWAAASYDVAGAPVHLIGVHLATFRFADRRKEELAALAKAARTAPLGLIIVGDFNATPWSFALRGFHAGSGLNPATRPVATWPSPIPNAYGMQSPIPYLPIDHAYAGVGWRVTSLSRGPRTSSDHFPIEVSLAPEMVKRH